MKYFIGLAIIALISACSSTQPSSLNEGGRKDAISSSESKKSNVDRDNINLVIRELQVCINEVNNGPVGKAVDGQILALNYDNPNAKALFNSDEKLSDDQVKAMQPFKIATQKCRQISNQITNPGLKKLYQQNFAKLDRVYEDLMFKRVTIGIANQERALLISDFRSQWVSALKNQAKGGI